MPLPSPHVNFLCFLISGYPFCRHLLLIPVHSSPDNMGLLDPATSDGRVIFFLPWENMTIAGTTDTPTSVTAHPIPGEDDINFILQEVRNYLSPDVEGTLEPSRFCHLVSTQKIKASACRMWFVSSAVRRGDVLAAWSGIRPLVTDPNSKDTQSICRNHVVSISDSGLVTIAGLLASSLLHSIFERVCVLSLKVCACVFEVVSGPPIGPWRRRPWTQLWKDWLCQQDRVRLSV